MRTIYLVLALLFIFSCKNAPAEKNAKEVTAHEVLTSRLDSLFNVYVKPDEPGAALLVSFDGEMVIGKGYGLRDLKNQEPITPSTNMRMGSVSKQFTALTVLSLVDQGKLKLSDTVYKIYPFEILKNVTVDQLLRHTSGIADAEEDLFKIWDTSKIAENKDLVAYYKANPKSIFSPGERMQYNNGAYELLAALVEEVSGQDFASYAKEQVFKKAGMKHTNFFNSAAPVEIPERAFCYQKDSLGNWKQVDGHFLNGLLGAGGVYTSVNDYYQYDQSLRNKTILQEASHKQIFSAGPIKQNLHGEDFTPIQGKETTYAMGWEVTDEMAVHGGGWFGTNTFVIHEFKRPLTIAIFMNSNRLFGNPLIDATYKIVDDYLNTLNN